VNQTFLKTPLLLFSSNRVILITLKELIYMYFLLLSALNCNLPPKQNSWMITQTYILLFKIFWKFKKQEMRMRTQRIASDWFSVNKAVDSFSEIVFLFPKSEIIKLQSHPKFINHCSSHDNMPLTKLLSLSFNTPLEDPVVIALIQFGRSTLNVKQVLR